MRTDVVMVCQECSGSRAIYNHLASCIGPFPVIVESAPSARQMVRVRARKIGWARMASQLAFLATIRPLLTWLSRSRVEELELSLNLSPLRAMAVSSVNAPECRELLLSLRPRVVVVNGARIIGKPLLESIPAIFLNTHAGITPRYRGAHGGYWALYNNDHARCGVTVHLIDSGIDTGAIIAQARITPTPRDTLVTYPLLQTAAALPLLGQAVRSALNGTLHPLEEAGDESTVWYHPGVFEYVRGAIRGIR